MPLRCREWTRSELPHLEHVGERVWGTLFSFLTMKGSANGPRTPRGKELAQGYVHIKYTTDEYIVKSPGSNFNSIYDVNMKDR